MSDPTRVVVAVRSRELRTSLFLSLDARGDATVVGSATSTSELTSQCRSLEPDVVVLEAGLSKQSLTDTLDAIAIPMWSGQIAVVGQDFASDDLEIYENVRMLTTIDELIDEMRSNSWELNGE